MVWVDLVSALGMAFIDFMRDKFFGRSTSEEVWGERLLKYSVAPCNPASSRTSCEYHGQDQLKNVRDQIQLAIQKKEFNQYELQLAKYIGSPVNVIPPITIAILAK